MGTEAGTGEPEESWRREARGVKRGPLPNWQGTCQSGFESLLPTCYSLLPTSYFLLPTCQSRCESQRVGSYARSLKVRRRS